MAVATLTSKGQITLPKSIRDRLGLKPGDKIAFRERTDGTIVVEPERETEKIDLMRLQGILKPRRRGITLADMEEAIRKGATDR